METGIIVAIFGFSASKAKMQNPTSSPQLLESTPFLFVLFVFCGVCANIDLSTRTNEP